jgi:hypothetical protein
MEWNEDKRNGELAMLIAKNSLKFGENNTEYFMNDP